MMIKTFNLKSIIHVHVYHNYHTFYNALDANGPWPVHIQVYLQYTVVQLVQCSHRHQGRSSTAT